MMTSSRRSTVTSTGTPPTTAVTDPGSAEGTTAGSGTSAPSAVSGAATSSGSDVVVVAESDVDVDKEVLGDDVASVVVVEDLDICACARVVAVLIPPETVVGEAMVVEVSLTRAEDGAVVVVVVEVVVVLGTVATIAFGEPVNVVWVFPAISDTPKLESTVSVDVTAPPPATAVDLAFIVQTVPLVCTTDSMDAILVNTKSTPFVREIVEQSIGSLPVIRNDMSDVADVAATTESVTVGAVSSMTTVPDDETERFPTGSTEYAL